MVIGHVCSFNCTGGMQRTGSASATCKKEGDMAVFILDSVHKLPAECIMPEATAAQLGTSDQDICEDFKCGFECAKFQEDLGCGWSTAVGKCKKGATTTPEEMTAGKCDLNKDGKVGGITDDPCATLLCGRDCAGALLAERLLLLAERLLWLAERLLFLLAERLLLLAQRLRCAFPTAANTLLCVRDCTAKKIEMNCGWASDKVSADRPAF